MATRTGRYTFKQPVFDAGDVVRAANLEQIAPGTVLTGCAGKAITFIRCRMINVAVDPAWTLEHCKAIQISRCAHEHPDWVEKGILADEVDDCSHVIDSDEILVDGVTVTTNYFYEDTVL